MKTFIYIEFSNIKLNNLIDTGKFQLRILKYKVVVNYFKEYYEI